MRVAVVGAGITGLALTHYLAERGVDARTFEADDRPGGVIRSRRLDGHILEVGPQRLRLTPGVRDLVEAAGLTDAVREAGTERLFVYADGRLREAPIDARTFLGTDLLSWRGKARLLAEPLTRPGAPQESAAQLFSRKFGREAYERFIGPLYGGLYGSDPAEMPAAYALEGLLERERETGSLLRAFRQRVGKGRQSPAISFAAGNQQLPDALARTYADRVELETPVTGLRGAGNRYRLDTPSGSHEADHVVVTAPADAAAELLAGLAPGAEALSALTYNPLAMVHLESDYDREGFGYQVALDEDLHTLGVSWNASMFDRDGLYTAFLGGMADPDLVDRPAEEIGTIAAREFERVTGVPARTLSVTTREDWFPAWDRSWDFLEGFETPPGVHLATNYTARMGIPSRVREARELAGRLAERTGA